VQRGGDAMNCIGEIKRERRLNIATTLWTNIGISTSTTTSSAASGKHLP